VTDALAPGVRECPEGGVRPEHPRPDLRREAWRTLNGWWAFAFDPDDRGLAEGWPSRRPDAFPDRIRVPFPWESLLAWGEEAQASDRCYYSRRVYREPDAVRHVDAIVFRSDAGAADYRVAPRHTTGWYCRDIDVPAAWRGQRVFLVVGAADFETTVWANGAAVGGHTGGYTPFECELTPHVAWGGRTTLVLRVHDAQAHDRQPGGKQHHWYQRTSGIWQSVYLEARGAAYVHRVHVTPDVARERAIVRVALRDRDRAPRSRVRVTVTAPDQRVSAALAPADADVVDVEVAVGAPCLWDVDAPRLYDVAAELLTADGRVEDLVGTYFGMRAITVEPLRGTPHRYVHLNGRPVYLRGVLDQGFHPAGVYSYPSDASIREDLRTAKRAGFNMVRMHIKLQDPRYLYWADREGVLLMADLPNFGYDGYGEPSKAWWEQTLREAVDRDYNHPSVFVWCLFNESWGVGRQEYQTMPERVAWVREMYRLAKRLDPTRLVEDMSPNNYDHVETDLNSWHFYIKEFAEAKAHIDRVVRETYPGSPFNYVPGGAQGNAPLMNSEYGGISAHDGDVDTSWHVRMLTNELRQHEKICGYVYTELTDLEWEHNGVVRYDRRPKEFGYPLSWVHAADVVAIGGPPLWRAAPGELLVLPLRLSLFSGVGPGEAALRWRLDAVDALGREHRAAVTGARAVRILPYRVLDPGPLDVTLPDVPHLGTLAVWLEDERGTPLARSFVWVHAHEDAPRRAARDHPPGSSRWQPPEGIACLRADVRTPAEARWDRWERLGGDAVVGLGRGTFRYDVRWDEACAGGELPEWLRDGRASRAEVVCEAAAGVLAPAQTDEERVPTAVRVRLLGQEVGSYRLPDAPADARGCLSWSAGLPGQYGYLLRVPVPAALLDGVVGALRTTGRVDVSFHVVDAACANGITLFGALAGRYPVSICLVVYR